MSRGRLAVLSALAAAACVAALPAAGRAQTESAESWTPPRTPDGRPDLQGRWTMATYTPFERPAAYADQAFLTEEQAAELSSLLTAEGTDPLAFGIFGEADPERRRQRAIQTQENIHYDNAIWLTEERPKGLSTRRTSLLVDPPDGRLPPLTGAAQRREDARTAARRYPPSELPDPTYDSYEARTLSERCIVWPHEGPPMLPPVYNDVLQIFQTPDHVVIFQEMSNNNPRIVPLDGRPHLPPAIRLWPGDSRGRWEGDTLVIETTNFSARARYHRYFRFRGSSAAVRVVERLTPVDAETIRYEFTVEDPTSWTSAWSAEFPMLRTDELMFEYACHEGNRDMENILSIARNLERQAAEKAAAESRAR